VPILKGEEVLGVMIIYHVKDVRPFTDSERNREQRRQRFRPMDEKTCEYD